MEHTTAQAIIIAGNELLLSQFTKNINALPSAYTIDMNGWCVCECECVWFEENSIFFCTFVVDVHKISIVQLGDEETRYYGFETIEFAQTISDSHNSIEPWTDDCMAHI